MVHDPALELARLAAQQDELERWLELPPERLRRVQPAISQWSALEHIAHVALATELTLRNLASLARGSGLLVVQGGEPVPGALELLAAGRIPRGLGQSPRIVRPPKEIDMALLRRWLADGRAARAALDPAQLGPSELKIPHQTLGALDAPQWARFASVHAEHHVLIAREILAAG